MPKMKTHSGAKKRIKKTGSGKLMREQTNNQHLFEQKSSRRKRRLNLTKPLSKADEKAAKRLLGLR
ncbi:MAG: 50S ribosomal protein L35 [Actinobacteria bacterium]|jgi:large subunit ribosomal protein L35|nr:50S ribosomal protein L35 [Micrococcales bacterium]MCB0904062.1 50S ribosomal protein L35 [Actinomycetota bacterium]MCO5299598.1 50S ribosomal protein L35 [Candidatus Nanopelagicales bacterium]MCB9428307.1 50S ribosomal protein L35 [Actinomycetota bacterium]HPE11821.1 50S ribosomal protein L35 [Actinomycetota bacterium]